MAVFFSSQIALAEIYKWVDADGNVHFGDKPTDPAHANEARPVELKSNYQPSVRTAEEQEAYDLEQRRIVQRNEMRRNYEAEERQALEESRQKQKADLCAAYEKDLEELTTAKLDNGVLKIVYITDESGKSVSSERQREIIEQLKKNMKNAGCE
jgi:hypothetical protein